MARQRPVLVVPQQKTISVAILVRIPAVIVLVDREIDIVVISSIDIVVNIVGIDILAVSLFDFGVDMRGVPIFDLDDIRGVSIFDLDNVYGTEGIDPIHRGVPCLWQRCRRDATYHRWTSYSCEDVNQSCETEHR